MGCFVKGVWHQGEVPVAEGAFLRSPSVCRDRLKKSAVESDPTRYHLYVSYACPWAHRTLIVRQIKGLESYVPVHVVDPYMGEMGWSFSKPEPNLGAKTLGEIYLTDPQYTGRVTVPVLWDNEAKRIVNNESSDITEMFNELWDGLASVSWVNLLPIDQQKEIDELSDWIYRQVNNKVYQVGFATTQKIYEQECLALFSALDQLDERLSHQDYLLGDQLLMVDVRLFVTLIRFDCVYHGHFKCNLQRIVDYPHLYAYQKRLYQLFKDTVDFGQIKTHYYRSHRSLNPSGIVPLGPREGK